MGAQRAIAPLGKRPKNVFSQRAEAARSSPHKSHFLPPLGRLKKFPSSSAEPHQRTASTRRMTNFLIVALLVLHFLLGNAEVEEEEISEFLYDYASRFSDYLYATVEYYSDNTTLIPTMYIYEEPQESVGSPLQCHLPLSLLLSLLGFLL